jgi:hypothetical protein
MNEATIINGQRSSVVYVRAVIAMLVLYALAMFAASYLPARMVVSDLSQFSGGADASAEINARFAIIAGRARLAAGLLAVLAVALLMLRHAAVRFISPGIEPAASAIPWREKATAYWPPPPLEAAIAALIMAAGAGLRVLYLGRAMRHDEAWTYMDYARMPLYAIPVRYTDVNDHVLNTLLIHISTAVFGNAPASIRLPALLFGIGVMPAGYCLARALAGGRAALIAVALLATSVPLIEFSINARGYQALTFFFLIMLLAGWYAIQGRRAYWLAVIGAGALGLYTVPTMIMPAFAAFVWFGLLALRLPPPARTGALADLAAAGTTMAAATLLLYLPILIANGPGVLLHSPGIHRSATWLGALATLPGYGRDILQHWTRADGVALRWLLLVLVAGAVVLPRHGRTTLALLLAALASAVLLQLVALKDIGPYRIWLPMLAVLLILAAISLSGALDRVGRLAYSQWRYHLASGAAVAVALCVFIGINVIGSNDILVSDETAYYPPAQRAAAALLHIGAGDTIGITAVRSDEVLYYALREGVVLRPIFTGADLRYFRRAGIPAAAAGAPKSLLLVVDAAFDHCTGLACAALARPDMTFAPDIKMLQNAADFTLLQSAIVAAPGRPL